MDEKVRIGVFICHCGTNIGGVIDCPAVTEYARTLPNVVFAQDNLYTCSETGLAQIKKGIEENDLTRVIVASCSPRTHEPLFRATCQEMGVNPYYFHFVNIRDQCSWVHMTEPEAATEKAKDLVRMGVARASHLQALEKQQIDVDPRALVIGGGIAGMTAALNLANRGFPVAIVERQEQLGGLLNELNKLFPVQEDASEVLKIREKVLSHENITVHLSTEIKEVEGYVGNYNITIGNGQAEETLKVGAIIVATGAKVLEPTGLYGYDGKRVITQLELEHLLKQGNLNVNNIVFIQCVGARIEERTYCSAVCCMSALKNARIIQDLNPDAQITILFRDMYTPGTEYEDYYREARTAGILFLKYELERLPFVEENSVHVFNYYTQQDLEIPADLVVLSTPLISYEDSKEIAQLLKVPREEYGFFLEAHVKLRPVDFATDGIFICGCAHWPKDVKESISQALAAASRASTILAHKSLEVEGAVATVDEELCVGCSICMKLCPYDAIARTDEGLAQVRAVLCKGCGLCGASCPERAITILHFTNEQILSQINVLMEEK
ncbi:MAG: CoB--CoM heterodisulfide reductase iron-sulfur subunit A family protein [Candidatus Helarchaeota archaeon]